MIQVFLLFSGMDFPEAESKIDQIPSMFSKLPCGLSLCCICGKAVSNPRNHFLKHNPEKHQCPVCFATTTRADNLRRHMRIKHNMTNIS